MHRKQFMALFLSATMMLSPAGTVLAAETDTEEVTPVVVEEVPAEEESAPEGATAPEETSQEEQTEEEAPAETEETEETQEQETVEKPVKKAPLAAAAQGTVVNVDGELKDAYKYSTETLKLVSDSTVSGFTTWQLHSDLKIDLNGHTLTATGELGVGYGAKITIMDSAGGGKFVNAKNITISSGGTFVITGGTYDRDLSAYMADGLFFNDNGDGTYTVSDKEIEKPEIITDGDASVDGVQFKTLQDAVDSIEGSGTVVLLKSVDLSEQGLVIREGQDITLDLAKVNKDSSKIPYAILAEPTSKGHIAVYGSLTMTDSDQHVSYIMAATKGTGGSYDVIDVYGSGTLTLHRIYMLANGNDNTVSGVHGTNAIGLHDSAKMIVDADVQDNYAIINSIGESTVRLFDKSTLYLKQGCLWNLGDGAAVEVNDNASVEMTGGFIRSGGLTSDKNDPDNATNWDGGTPVIMNGGSFNMSAGRIRSDVKGTNFQKSGSAKVSVSGGYLKQELLQEDCAEGYYPAIEAISENGTLTDYYTVTNEETFAEIVSRTVYFQGTIGLNYYISVPETFQNDPDAYFEYTFDKEDPVTEKIKVADLPDVTRKGVTCKQVTVRVLPAYIQDTITLKLCSGSGKNLNLRTNKGVNVTDGDTYSVYAYCDDVRKLDDQKAADMAYKLQEYGKFVQKYFGYRTETAATTLDVSGVTLADLKAYAPSVTGSVKGISYDAFSFLFLEDSTITYKFRLEDGHSIDEYTFTDKSGKKLTPEKNGSRYYINIAGIGAPMLGTAMPVTVTDKQGSKMTVSNSGITYSYLVMQKLTDKNILDLVKSLYLYHKAADAYFN